MTPAYVLELPGEPDVTIRMSSAGYVSVHESGDVSRIWRFSPMRIREFNQVHGDGWLSAIVAQVRSNLRHGNV